MCMLGGQLCSWTWGCPGWSWTFGDWQPIVCLNWSASFASPAKLLYIPCCSRFWLLSLRLCWDCQPISVFWHVQIVSRLIFRKKGLWNAIFANRIQAAFGVGMKRDSNRIYTDASQSGCSGHSNRISKCLLRHSQNDNDDIKSRVPEVHQSG